MLAGTEPQLLSIAAIRPVMWNERFVPDPDLKGEGHAKVTAQHVHPLSPSLAHHALNRGADLLGGVQHMLIIEVRIARR
jgi:hypothetical protein